MPLNADIIDVTKPGAGVEILVAFFENGKEVDRKTIVFGPNEVLDEAAVRLKINQIGTQIETALGSESFVKTLIGRRFPVERPPVIPDPTLPDVTRIP